MQDSFYSDLKVQEIQIINHTIQNLNQDFFLAKVSQPAHPDFLKPIAKHPNIRNSVRCLLINHNQELCLLYSRAKDYYAIPGGGIEPGESLLQTLNRETLEETGFLLKDPKPIGNIYEQRHNRITTTFFFSALPDKILHPNSMPDELEEDYILKWLPLSKALQIFQTTCHEQQLHNFPSYKGAFISYRFLELLQYFLKTRKINH